MRIPLLQRGADQLRPGFCRSCGAELDQAVGGVEVAAIALTLHHGAHGSSDAVFHALLADAAPGFSIAAEDGFVVAAEGRRILAVWTVGLAGEDHARRALAAARRAGAAARQTGFGIGVHCGTIWLGHGSEVQEPAKPVEASGAAIDIAHGLAAAAAESAEVLASAAAVRAAGLDLLPGSVRSVTLQGRATPTAVVSLT